MLHYTTLQLVAGLHLIALHRMAFPISFNSNPLHSNTLRYDAPQCMHYIAMQVHLLHYIALHGAPGITLTTSQSQTLYLQCLAVQ